jgi:hypothetical protein
MREDNDLDGLRVGAWVYRKRYSALGHPVYGWEQADVAAIDLRYLDCSVYLYPSYESAIAGESAGGSGFLASIKSKYDGTKHYYIVTNHHVSLHAQAVRLNTADGKVDPIDLRGRQWIEHQDGDDLAVCPLEPSDAAHRFLAIDATSRPIENATPSTMLLTERQVQEHVIGPGDEVFMIGRFFNHAGQQRNLPTTRFGRIAQMPWEPIRQEERGFDQESFLVEIQSIGGYSGSPVFLFPTPKLATPVRIGKPIPAPWLLGVNWGHMDAPSDPVYRKFVRRTPTGKVDVQYIRSEENFIKPYAGLAPVIPAWKLQALLDRQDLADIREERDEVHHSEVTRTSGGTMDES